MGKTRTETKKRPAERFSILIVPRNRSRIRRIEASSRSFKALIAAVGLCASVLAASVAGMLYYRSAYIATHGMRIQAARFVKESSQLAVRVAELEGAVSRTERFAAKIESSAIGKPASVGLGPVDEQDALPDSPRSSPISLGGGMWKSPFGGALSDGLSLSLDRLMKRSDSVERKLHAAFARQQDKLYFWASLPTVWPAQGWVTSEFGARRHWGGRGRLHEGIDIAGPRGTPIIAPGDGVVTYTGYHRGYGNTVIIDHGFGISTVFAHCSSIFAQEGQRVKRGALIAAVGNTGRSTGPHLHFEVQVDGVPVDPRLYLSSRM